MLVTIVFVIFVILILYGFSKFNFESSDTAKDYFEKTLRFAGYGVFVLLLMFALMAIILFYYTGPWKGQ